MSTNTPGSAAEKPPTTTPEDKRQGLKEDIAAMEQKMTQRRQENESRAESNTGILGRLKNALNRPRAEVVMQATLAPDVQANVDKANAARANGERASNVVHQTGAVEAQPATAGQQPSAEQQARNARAAEMLNQTRANIDQAGADRRSAADRSPLTPARGGQAVLNEQTGRYETPAATPPRQETPQSLSDQGIDTSPLGRKGQAEYNDEKGKFVTPETPAQKQARDVDNVKRHAQEVEARLARVKQIIESGDPNRDRRVTEAAQLEKELAAANKYIAENAPKSPAPQAEAPRPTAQTPTSEAKPADGLSESDKRAAEQAAKEDEERKKLEQVGKELVDKAKKDDAERERQLELKKLGESGKNLADWARQDDANREQIFANLNKEPTQEEVDKVAHQIWEDRVRNNKPGDALADQDAARKQIAREREEAKKKHLESRPPGSTPQAEQSRAASSSNERRSGGGGGGGGGGNGISTESLRDAVVAAAGAPAERNGAATPNAEADQADSAEQNNGNETAEVVALKKELAEMKKLLAEQGQQIKDMATLITALAEKNGIDKKGLAALAKGLGLMSILALLGVTVSGMSRGMSNR